MKETPILFNGAMVRATIEDSKHQTRRTRGLEALNEGYYRDRISKVEVRDGSWCFWEVGHGSSALPVVILKCPLGVTGDRLWVRETCAWSSKHEGRKDFVQYRSDGEIQFNGMPQRFQRGPVRMRWTPSIHMPRWASRITLEITEVRVQRLQDISEEDCYFEGIPVTAEDARRFRYKPKIAFEALWESINGTGSWEKNPWVWAITFRRLQ